MLTVGVHDTEGSVAYKDGPTVAQVATWNEFGTDTIPPRPFLSGWVDANASRIRKMLSDAGKEVLKGQLPTEAALAKVGLLCVGGIQASISDGVGQGNAASTIARKGSSKQLIDTGQLRSAITQRVA